MRRFSSCNYFSLFTHRNRPYHIHASRRTQVHTLFIIYQRVRAPTSMQREERNPLLRWNSNSELTVRAGGGGEEATGWSEWDRLPGRGSARLGKSGRVKEKGHFPDKRMRSDLRPFNLLRDSEVTVNLCRIQNLHAADCTSR